MQNSCVNDGFSQDVLLSEAPPVWMGNNDNARREQSVPQLSSINVVVNEELLRVLEEILKIIRINFDDRQSRRKAYI
jgi:hypothetical protein